MDGHIGAIARPGPDTSGVFVAGRTLLQLAQVLVRLEDQLLSRDVGLSYRQMRILKHVGAGVTSGTELGRIFGVTAPAISETIESLVRKGLLRREPHETDRRAVILLLTDEGSSLNERAEQAERALAREVLDPLADDEVETLLELATKVLIPSQENLISRRLANG